ncbi:NUDIX hydrolase [Candidatus Harpocratesius sp.]
MDNSKLLWKQRQKKVIFRNQYIGLRNDEVERPDGELGHYIVIENRNFVNVFCHTPNNTFLMVYQYRYPWKCFSWEPPSGIIETFKGETPEEAARREVEEETGYKVKSLIKLAKVHPFAMCAGWAHVFYAEVVHSGNQHLDPGEFLVFEEKTPDQIEKLIEQGNFLHGMSLLGWEIVKKQFLK